MTDAPEPATDAALPRLLGLAGLLPQLGALAALLWGGADYHYAALAIGYGYAALIFSFLGGMWWGLGAAAQTRQSAAGAQVGPSGAQGIAVPRWLWVAAVAPSLIAGATYLPWIFGGEWPGPSLILLGLAIAASPLIDARLSALTPAWWMPLRWVLSLGLGGVTLLLGVLG